MPRQRRRIATRQHNGDLFILFFVVFIFFLWWLVRGACGAAPWLRGRAGSRNTLIGSGNRNLMGPAEIPTDII